MAEDGLRFTIRKEGCKRGGTLDLERGDQDCGGGTLITHEQEPEGGKFRSLLAPAPSGAAAENEGKAEQELEGGKVRSLLAPAPSGAAAENEGKAEQEQEMWGRIPEGETRNENTDNVSTALCTPDASVFKDVSAEGMSTF